MYKVRVGNDINIQWRIFRNDSPEDFSGKTLRLLMRGTSQTIEVRDYVLEGNVIKWEYKGKDQRSSSTFTFTLIENEGKDDMFTVDKCDVLRLVSCSCQADDDDGRFDMFIDTDIVLPSNGVDGKTPVLETGETQTLEPGSEATSEIVPDGEDEAGNPRYKVNLGIPAGEPFTYDDFTPEQIEGLKKPALDAAAVAEAAADAATKAAANADNAAKTATEAASSANDAANRAGQAAVDAGLAKTAAEEAAERATEAAGAAGSAADEANAAAESASQTNTEVSTAEQGRVTAEEQRAAAEQTRQTEFSQLKQEAQTATQEANAAAAAANEAAENIEQNLSEKQGKTDESLQTEDKTVVGAINEVLGKAEYAVLHKIYESYNAVYNKATGYWELNGLTDLTEEEMYDIWLWTHNIINQPDLAQAFSSAPIRTTFPHPSCSVYRQGLGTSLNQAAYSCKFLEIFHVASLPDGSIKITGSSSNACHNAFNNCLRLREITDILDVSVNVPGLLSAAFNLCAKLSKVRIKGLRQDVSFEHSPLLSYESLNYIVTSAANTSAITITVHPTTYSYLTGTAQPTAEVGGTTDEWQALVTTAQEKQISFAVPEETQSEVTE